MDLTDESAHDYRLQNINEIQQQLEGETDKRNLSKKYRKGIQMVNAAHYILSAKTIGLNAIGLGLLSTIIAAPVVMTIEAITVGAAILFVVGRELNKKFVPRAEKHEKIRVLAETKLNKISDLISKAPNDNVISDEEFTIILSEANDFKQLKEKIRAKTNENVNANAKKQRPQQRRQKRQKER